ncbi:MAG: hypothetical protein R3E79_47425 [Caldilineaceae bacterium]
MSKRVSTFAGISKTVLVIALYCITVGTITVSAYQKTRELVLDRFAEQLTAVRSNRFKDLSDPNVSLAVLLDRTGLGESGEAYLVDGESIMASESRFIQGATGYIRVDTSAVEKALNREEGTDIIDNYQGVPVLSTWRYIELDEQPYALVVEISVDEVLGPVREFGYYLLLVATGLSLVSSLIIYAILRRSRVTTHEHS